MVRMASSSSMKLMASSKFRPLTVVKPTDKIMKEAMRMVLEYIYKPIFENSKNRSLRGPGIARDSTLTMIKNWDPSPRWFMKLNIKNCFHNIDRLRLIAIMKEEIDDPMFFKSIPKAVRVEGEKKRHGCVPYSVVLSPIFADIYLNKLDEEIERIRLRYAFPMIRRIESPVVRAMEGSVSGDSSSALDLPFDFALRHIRRLGNTRHLRDQQNSLVQRIQTIQQSRTPHQPFFFVNRQ